jgi:hypothetical protein
MISQEKFWLNLSAAYHLLDHLEEHIFFLIVLAQFTSFVHMITDAILKLGTGQVQAGLKVI